MNNKKIKISKKIKPFKEKMKIFNKIKTTKKENYQKMLT